MTAERVAWVEVVARTRRSAVGVVASGHRGSGYFAMPNGLVVTSQQVVGYDAEVELVLDDGRRVEGRVVYADVGRDLACIVPREPLNAAVLRASPGLPKLAESVMMLGVGEHGATAVPSIVSVVERVVEGETHIEIDAPESPELRGAPLLDADGRVLGLRTRRGAILPVGAYQPTLAPLGGPATTLVGMKPSYACPSCAMEFSPAWDRCRTCGARLPHAVPLERALESGELPAAPRSGAALPFGPPITAVRVVREMLEALGLVEGRVRAGDREWHVPFAVAGSGMGPKEVTVRIDPTGRFLLFRIAVSQVARAEHEPFLRLLLTLNDETAGLYRLSTSDDTVYLSTVDPVESVLEREVPLLFSELVRLSVHFRKVLSEAFDLPPAEAAGG